MAQLPFSNGQARFLIALTEALFHGAEMRITPRQVVDNIQLQFSEVTPAKIGELRLSFDATAIVLGGFLFRLMSVAARAKRVKKRLADSKFNLFQDMARLRGIIYAGYYGHWQGASEEDNFDNPIFAQIGFKLPKQRVRDAGEMELKLVDGRELHRDHILEGDDIPDEVDVIVVGSGSGGAVAAWNIAQHGHSVLVVEAGPFYPSTRITFEERRMTGRLFKHAALQTSSNNDFVIFQGSCVGGSSVLNNGICLKPPSSVFDHWDSIGAGLNRADLDQAFEDVRGYLGIDEIEHRSGRKNGPHLKTGFDAYKATSGDPDAASAHFGWFHKNYGPPRTTSACAYCGYCNTGCPYGRKLGMAQTYLPDAARNHGLRIVANAKVERILWQDDDAAVRKARGVTITIDGGDDRPIRARKGVVVAGGTIASSKLLRRSGFDNAGYGISLNIASPIIALMSDGGAGPAWDEDQMATYVDIGGYLIESHFQPPMSMAAMMPGWFGEHQRRMQNYNRLASAGILFPADRKGHLSGDKLDFRLDGSDMPLIRKASATLAKIHFAAGALEVYPALTRGQTLARGEDVDAFFASAIRESDDITLSSSHPHGGNAISTNPANGVIDTEMRVHGTNNVYVTDASTFPSCIKVNAQFTTMAVAQYATGRGDIF